MKRIVIALGGNALGTTPFEQIQKTKETAKAIVNLIKLGHEVIITHGNGPQVGIINLAFEEASKTSNTPKMPFCECGAMSQGYIGYHLQNAIQNELINNNINKSIATLITQVEVAKNDPAFLNPTKPVGAFYSKVESEKISLEKSYIMKEEHNRGYRRVVPSPKPIDILEKNIILDLIKANHLIIAVGGGGIPVIKENGKYLGIDAVIDKDLASSKLAILINADILIMLTAVKKVSINYGRDNQINLDKLSLNDIDRYIKENQFAKGSMLEKIEAGYNFVHSNNKRTAIIGALADASIILNKNIGTKIINQEEL